MKNYAKKELGLDGCVYYYNSEDGYHRLDGPAKEYSNGTKAWFINDKCHRLDGPAIVWENGSKGWWFYGRCYFKTRHNRLVLFFMLEPDKININLMEE
jgi:hypothetical protein